MEGIGRVARTAFAGRMFVPALTIVLAFGILSAGCTLCAGDAMASYEARAEVFALQAKAEAHEGFLNGVASLELPVFFQYPDLPTGCESVALTDVLVYEGFSLSTTEIADTWLPTSDDDFVNAFMGDPHSIDGHSCMAPAIASTANDYLASQRSSLYAVNATGMSLEDLFRKVAQGTPVVVWCTIDMQEAGEPYAVMEQDGMQYCLYASSHCVVLEGYDLATETVIVDDPISGETTYSMEAFAASYYALGSQAVYVS